jgi:hypothetical protein
MAKRAKTRYHEAGHVLVAHVFGVDTEFVDIGKKEKGEERGSSGLTKYSEDMSKLSCVERVAVCLAGDIAERRYSGVVPQSSWNDFETALFTIMTEGKPGDRVDELWGEGFDLANKVVNDNWYVIEALANLFMQDQVTEYPMRRLGYEQL